MASSTTLSSATTLSGSNGLTSATFDQTVDGVHVTGTAVISVDWSQPATLGTVFDSNLVRQGRFLDPLDSFGRTPTGSMSIRYSISDLKVSWGSIGPLSLSPSITTTGSCDMKASGANYTCDLTSSSIELIPTFYTYIGPYVDLSLSSHVTVTPTGVATLRSATFGGNPGGTAALSLGESPVTDTLFIPCTVGAGDELSYGLGQLSTTPGLSVDTSLVFDVGAAFPDPIIPAVEHKVSVASPTIALGTTTGDVTLTGVGATFDMGAVQKNNIPPVVDAGFASYSGTEGTPIRFNGLGSSSVCGFPTLRWDFSDGGVAFGAQPYHTFADNGTFSGQLTATDATGLSNSTTFAIVVANADPVVNAGPDTTSDWGRLVAFNGQATDPGAGDQSTLQYTWDFGDGTPSATGGPSVFHAYAAPGLPGYYDATLTVTDKDGGSSSDVRRVYVTKRDTTTANLGNATGTYDTAGQLSASLVDEYGVSLNARPIVFSVDGSPVGSASTSASGTAVLPYTPLLAAGIHGTAASFAGDLLYNSSNDSGTIAVAQKATTVAYTGALNGGANKTVGLSAVLVDATGKALFGKTIVFHLGAQMVSAVTNINGVASTSLKLNQKNGVYPLTATWAPAGADSTHYVGSSAATTFKLQSK